MQKKVEFIAKNTEEAMAEAVKNYIFQVIKSL